MEPNIDPIKEIFEELFGLLETMETQSMAVLQFLKDQRIATDKKLGPYLESAGNASSVKWRAARVRMEYLLSSIQKESKEAKEPQEKDKESRETETTRADESAKEGKSQERRAKEQGRSAGKESKKELDAEGKIAKAGADSKAASASAGAEKKSREKERKPK